MGGLCVGPFAKSRRDAEWIEKGMYVTNLERREMPNAVATKFDIVVREGVTGLQMR